MRKPFSFPEPLEEVSDFMFITLIAVALLISG